MQIRLKPWQSLLLIAATILLFTYSVQRFRYRLVRKQADLVSLLPPGDVTTFFINVEALRAGRILQLISAAKTQERDYQQFVSETGFDYIRDLNAIAGSKDDRDSFFLLQGRFDWDRLTQYTRSRGGECHDYCVIRSTTPGKWASFERLQPDVVGIAVSPDSAAVRHLGKASRVQTSFPDQALWIRVPSASLDHLPAWPGPVRILATTLHAAQSLTFSAGAGSNGDLQLEMDAHFATERVAETVRNQLELETKMLKLELARENAKASDADLTGLLVSGSFQLVNSSVVAIWPIRRELLETLQIQ